MSSRVFYCWQSDLPDATNREFLRSVLAAAVTRITTGREPGHAVQLDSDTLGVPGAPPITEALLDKIRTSTVFVADVSLTNATRTGKKSPNPNVLVELGYALHALSWRRLVLVMNTALGGPSELPFDFRHMRVETYSLADPDPARADVASRLGQTLEASIRSILDDLELSARTHSRANASPISLSFERRNQSITREVHDYRLAVLLQPRTPTPVEKFHVEVSFPRGLVPNPGGVPTSVGPQGKDRRETFRVGSDVVGTLFPGEPQAVMHIPYRVNSAVYENEALMNDEVRGVIYVPDKEPEALSAKVRDLQIF